MSVREYIGARYVPVFADPIEWDGTLSYEPLTVVKYQGASYVSRQWVPEGITLDNTQYWILWADYNAQLEAYRQEVQAFDGRITANADEIAAIKAANWVTNVRIADNAVTTRNIADEAVTGAKIADGSIDSGHLAQDSVTANAVADGAIGTGELQNGAVTLDKMAANSVDSSKIVDGSISINKLNTTISRINATPKLALYFGNSYTLGTGATDGKGGIFDRTKQLFDEAHYYWDDGIGFDEYSKHPAAHTFYAQLQNAIADTRFNHNSVTDIFFVSAMGDTRAVCEGHNFSNLQSTVAAAKAAFPNAKIYIYFAEITARKNIQSAYSVKYPLAQIRTHIVFEYYATLYGYTYLGWGGWNINFNENFTSDDYYHPNNAGYNSLAEFFITSYKNKPPYRPKMGAVSRSGYATISYKMQDPIHGTCRTPNLRASAYVPMQNGVAFTPFMCASPADANDHPYFYPSFNDMAILFATRLDADNTNKFSVGRYTSVVSEASGNVNVNMTPAQNVSSENVNVAQLFGTAFIAPIDMWIEADLTIA